jgi:DNA topoisomerase IB
MALRRGQEALADSAGGTLVRSDPGDAGIRRRRRGRGFSYLGLDAAVIKDPRTLARIKALVIPPAWEDVWICVDPQGHTQAIGTDAAGRRQYRYHDLWRENYRSERAGLLSPRGGALSLRFVSSRASELRLANIRSGLPVAD